MTSVLMNDLTHYKTLKNSLLLLLSVSALSLIWFGHGAQAQTTQSFNVSFVPETYRVSDESGSILSLREDLTSTENIMVTRGGDSEVRINLAGRISAMKSGTATFRLISNADSATFRVGGVTALSVRSPQEQIVKNIYVAEETSFDLQLIGDTDKYRASLSVLGADGSWRNLVNYESRDSDVMVVAGGTIFASEAQVDTTNTGGGSQQLVTPAGAQNQFEVGDIVSTTSAVNLRPNASTANAPLGVLNVGTVGTVTATTTQPDQLGYVWVQVNFVGEQTGWVAQDFLQLSNRTALLAYLQRMVLVQQNTTNPASSNTTVYADDDDIDLQSGGLLARYFDNSGFAGPRLVAEKIEGPINFDSNKFRNINPGSNGAFSVIWRGALVIPEDSEARNNSYVLRFSSDGSHEVRVGGSVHNGVGSSTTTVDMRSGYVPIEITYDSFVSSANYAKLEWAVPGSGNFRLVAKKNMAGPLMSNSAPMVSIVQPEGDEVTIDGNMLELEVMASDIEGEVETLEIIKVGNEEQVLRTITKPGQMTMIMFENIPAGTYYIQARATDDEGMFAVSRTIRIVNSESTNPPPEPSGDLRWSNNADWQSLGMTKPAAGEAVTIPSGITMIMDESTPALGGIINNGRLIADENKNVSITSRYLLTVGEGAEFIIGEESDKFDGKLTLTLTGQRGDTGITGETPCGNKTLCSTDGGKMSIYGNAPRPTWTKLSTTAARGARSIQVEDNLNGWKIGDEIVVTSTDFDPSQAEKRTITNINGRTISFAQPLLFNHFGAIQTIQGVAVDQRAEVMNLSRNILVQGDSASESDAYGAHTMVMNEHHHQMMMLAINQGVQFVDMIDPDEYPEFVNDPELYSHVEGVEFYRGGQQGVMARYPLHSHMYGYADEMTFKNNSVHNSYQRCYTVHGTFDMNVESNVAYDVVGHCYFVEDGIEEGNTFRDNIGALIKSYPDPDRELIDDDRVPSVFWISNPNNNFIDNVAAGAYGNGFSYEPPVNPTGPSFTARINPRKAPVGRFEGNVAHSNIHSDSQNLRSADMRPDRAGSNGLWAARLDCNRDDDVCEFGDFLGYKNGGAGVFIHHGQKHDLSNMILTDNHQGAFIQYVNRSVLEDALIVAETSNIGNPTTAEELAYGRSLPVWESNRRDRLIGVLFHTDGVVKDSTFVGYTNQGSTIRAAISGRDSYERHARWSENNRLVNSTPVYHTLARVNDSYTWQHLVKDTDGALSGTGSYREYRAVQHPIGIDDTCVQHRPGDSVNNYGYLCNTQSSKLIIDHDSFDNGNQNDEDDFVPLSRDGQTYQVLRGYLADVFMPINNTYEIETAPRNYSGMMIAMRDIFAGANYIVKIPTTTELEVDTLNNGRSRTASSLSSLQNNNSDEVVLYHDGQYQYVKIQWVDEVDFADYPEKLELVLE